MSMILGLSMVSDKTIDQLLETPVLVWAVVAPDDPEFLAEALANGQKKQGFFARLFGGQKPATEPKDLPDLELTEDESNEIDLDKAWHTLSSHGF